MGCKFILENTSASFEIQYLWNLESEGMFFIYNVTEGHLRKQFRKKLTKLRLKR